MKTVLKTFLAATLSLAVFAVGASAKQAAVGKPAPDFTLTDLDGKTHSLSNYKGKTVVIEWVNPECPFVVKHYDKSGNIPSLQKSATDDGVVWLSINSGRNGGQGDFEPARAKAWMEKTKAAPTAYLRDRDTKVGQLYGAKATPHLYVVDPRGTLVYEGAIDSIRSSRVDDIAKAENYVTSALAAVKAGKPVATPVTQAYGCGIKY
jgi:hypothetical protein